MSSRQNASSASGVEELKKSLFSLVTEINGLAPGDSAKEPRTAELLRVAQALGRVNPNPDAAQSPLINGRWALIYTAKVDGSSSSEAANPDALQAAVEILYNFFYRNLPLLAGSAVGRSGSTSFIKVRGNFQDFDTRRGIVDNQVRFTAFGKPGCISVQGSACVVQPKIGASPVNRLKATFEEFQIEWDGAVRLKAPLRFLNPTGYVDTHYLDDEIRVSYGDKGSIFIARKVPLGAP